MMSHSPEQSGGDENGIGEPKKSGKRELSTSKRAAQNRAAQVGPLPQAGVRNTAVSPQHLWNITKLSYISIVYA